MISGAVLAVILALLIRWIVHSWFLFPMNIPDNSMAPATDINLRASEVVYVHRQFDKEDLKPGAVVVLRHPQNENIRMIRRIVAGPGQIVSIQDGALIVNGNRVRAPYQEVALQNLLSKRSIIAGSAWDEQAPLTLVNSQYYVLADDRFGGVDSRFFGPVPAKDIQGIINP